MLQDLGSDHLPILLSVPLSPGFRPNERPPSFNFQKARCDDFASHIDSHCPSAEEYSFLSLSSAAAFFTSLALNAAKSSIPFSRIKRPPKAWWSPEVEEAVSERRKAFAAVHRSDENRQAYISASRRASSVIAKVKTSRGTTRLMSWPDGERYLRPTLSLVVSLLLSLISTLVFSQTGGVLSHLNFLTHKFPRFPSRNLCSFVMLAVFFLVFAATDTAYS